MKGEKNKQTKLYGYFKRQTSNISPEKTRTLTRKEKPKAQNNAIRTDYVKAKIDQTQQNSRCRLCGDRDQTINHIISEYDKLAQRYYNIRHNLVGKVIHSELWKKFEFDHTNKWYMHDPESVQENERCIFFFWFWNTNGSSNRGQTIRSSDSHQKKKKKRSCRIVDFADLDNNRVKLKEI